MNPTKRRKLLLKVRAKHRTTSTIELRTNTFFSVAKRFFDIIISLLVIIFLLSWLLPVLAILIKLDSKGPVFFLQKRVGAHGKTFRCIKLRSMVINSLANVEQAGADDPRITRVGKYLRLSYLDEFPQFFNVLFGQMSVVGPRPHMLHDCFEFLDVVPEYNLRHMVKPGITGMAQVKGYRGKINSYFDITHRNKFDMFYIKKACFILDLKIIFQTLAQVVSVFGRLSHKGTAIEYSVTKSIAPTVTRKKGDWYEQMVPSERRSA
jgi:putative colanic acid biosysnthesis UDP-glucose lipid carrier transferase